MVPRQSRTGSHAQHLPSAPPSLILARSIIDAESTEEHKAKKEAKERQMTEKYRREGEWNKAAEPEGEGTSPVPPDAAGVTEQGQHRAQWVAQAHGDTARERVWSLLTMPVSPPVTPS